LDATGGIYICVPAHSSIMVLPPGAPQPVSTQLRHGVGQADPGVATLSRK